MVAAKEKAREEKAPSLIVGVGCFESLERLVDLLNGVPAGASLAFLVMGQGTDDARARLSAQVRHLTLCDARDGVRVRAETAYFLSSEQTVDVSDGRLVVGERRGPGGLGNDIDHMFRSLAQSLGHRCAGVLVGANGACFLGLRELRSVGALTISVAETSSTHPNADLCVSHDEVVPALLRFAQLPEWALRIDRPTGEAQGETPAPVRVADSTRARLAEILSLGRDLELRHYKSATVDRRLLRRMGIVGFDDPDAYLDRVASCEAERDALVRDLLICVTSFFRNPQSYEKLAQDVLPQLVEAARADGTLRVWTPGCATGEEPYSIAMLLHEALQGSPVPIEVQIFATDVSADAVGRARLGLYSAEAIEAVPQRLREQCFEPLQGGLYRVIPAVREMVSFAVHDLCTDPPFSRMNLVCCRNVLIYLRPEAQERLGRLFHFALRPGGVLFLGASESLGTNASLFHVVSKGDRIFRKSAGSVAITPPHGTTGYRQRTYEVSPTPVERRASRRPSRSSADHARDALLSLLPAAVVVDGAGQVIYSHGELSPFLRLPSEPRFELQAMARESIANRLRGAIYKARRDERPVTAVASPAPGLAATQIVVTPAPHLGEGTVIVSFSILETDPVERAAVEPEDADQRLLIEQLERELMATREDLQHTVEELETANEELRASNEESMSMNEELQSANEELEATTEELRSLNEELATLNARLKSKVDELQFAHDDLSNFFASTNLATLFLDDALCIKRFTPAAEELLDLVPADVGRRINNFARVLLQRDLAAAALQVLTSFAPVSEEIELKDGRWFIRRVAPYRTQHRRIEGVVVTFQDITEQKHVNEQLRVRERQQAVLASFGLRSFQTHDNALFVHRVVREVRDIMGADLCRISEFSALSHRLLPLSHVGFERGSEGLSVDLDTPAGYALAATDPVVVRSLSTDGRFSGTRELIGAGAESGVVCVIEDGESSYGVIEVYADESRDFSADSANFVQSIASVLAHSFSRARRQVRSALENRISRALTAAMTLDQAVTSVLDAFAGELGVDVCEYWVSDGAGQLSCAASVAVPGGDATAQKWEEFHGRRFERSEGFIGAVWERGAPQWLDDLEAQPGFLRARQARELGLVSTFGFPVVADGEVRAVLAFMARRPLLRDAAFVTSLEGIGRAMGQFFLRSDAEARLSEFAAIVESSDAAILSKSLDGTIRSWNAAAEELYGYTAAEAIGSPVSIIVPEDRHAELERILDSVARGVSVDSLDTERVRKDGTRVTVCVTISPVLDATGKVIGASAVGRDVGLQKRAEEALRDSQNRLMQAFRFVPFPVFIISETGEMLLASDRAFELTGYQRDEIDRLRMALDPVFGKRAHETYGRVRALAESGPQHDGTFRILTADGVTRLWDFHSAGMGVLGDGVALSVTVAQDVTEQREAEARLRDSEWRFRQILVNAPVPMMLHDDRGAILEISKSWKDVFGYGLNELPDLGTFTSVMFEERGPEVFAFINDVATRDSAAEDIELRARPKHGQLRTLLFNASPLGTLPDGRQVRVVAAVDITSQKQAEARLVAAGEQKDQFLAMLGHELRNPLAAIRSASEVLNLVDHDDLMLQKSRAILSRQTAHMAKLLDGLLDVTRIARGKIELESEPLDVREVLEEIFHDYQSRERDGSRMRLEASGPLLVRGDRVRLRQVFDNIIANAVKFAPDGDVEIEGDCAEGQVRVRVCDNGAGIDEQLLPHIFEPFRQASQSIARSEGGLGLGLALVKGLVELHDGEVVVSSGGDGEGTIVEVTLPEAPGSESHTPKPLDPEGPHSFLVIEDNVDLAEALGDLLEAAGHVVTVAHDGASGLAAMDASLPDVLLCDIGLPGELSGYDVARAIRQRPDWGGVLLVALTGYGRSEDKREAREAGFDFHLTKPIGLASIDRILRRVSGDEVDG